LISGYRFWGTWDVCETDEIRLAIGSAIAEAATQPTSPCAGRRNLVIGFALAVATVAVYGQTAWNDFEFLNVDDNEYVTANVHGQRGLNFEDIGWAFGTSFHAYNWHPLSWISLQLDNQLFGLNPRWYHFTNLVLHTANTLLLFALLLRMTAAAWPSALVAGLFALHPAHVESVAWVTERKDVLSILFWLLTTLAYVRYVERPGWGRYLLMLVLFALGLMAKPMVVTLPATLLLFDYWPLRRMSRQSIRGLIVEKLPLFALVAASLPLTIKAQAVAIRTFEQLPLMVRAKNAVVSYAQYIGMLFWPSDLAVFYPHPRGSIPEWKVAAAAALLLAITVVAVALARRRPYLLVGWLWYLGTLVPVIGIMQVGVHGLADRYTYIPYIGLFIMVGWGLADLAGEVVWRQGAAALAAAAALAICGVLTWRQVGYWHDSVTLWTRTIAVTHDNPLAHDYLAMALVERGDNAGACQQYREAIRLVPNGPWLHCNLAKSLERLGQRDEAVVEFERALELDPAAVDCHGGIAQVLESQGKLEPALEHYRSISRLEPKSDVAHFHVGRMLAVIGKLDDALKEYDAALDLNPDSAALHNNRGVVLERLGRFREAAASYGRAAKLEPRQFVYHCNLAYALHESGQTEPAMREYAAATRLQSDWRRLAMEEAWQKATHPDAAVRNGRDAVRLARQVCQASSFHEAQPLDVLAAACAESGRFEEAVSLERQAIALMGGASAAVQREARERLGLYEKRKPYRQP
jgi:tetratricopeptide (TPR) repeat protein